MNEALSYVHSGTASAWGAHLAQADRVAHYLGPLAAWAETLNA